MVAGFLGSLLLSIETIQQVGHFRFLGTIITNDLTCDNNVIDIIKRSSNNFTFYDT